MNSNTSWGKRKDTQACKHHNGKSPHGTIQSQNIPAEGVTCSNVWYASSWLCQSINVSDSITAASFRLYVSDVQQPSFSFSFSFCILFFLSDIPLRLLRLLWNCPVHLVIFTASAASAVRFSLLLWRRVNRNAFFGGGWWVGPKNQAEHSAGQHLWIQFLMQCRQFELESLSDVFLANFATAVNGWFIL